MGGPFEHHAETAFGLEATVEQLKDQKATIEATSSHVEDFEPPNMN
jgi:hypothetical protein